MKAAYDPAVLTEIIAQLQRVQLITIEFSDGSTWEVYGWLEEFMPDELTEGEQPTASVKFCCSGENEACVETAPVYAGSGT
jgi:hypothetical protein